MYKTVTSPLSAATLAATVMLAPVSASALSSITYNGAWNSFVNGVQTTLGSTDRTVSAGPFRMTSNTTGDGLETFLAWCFQLDTVMVSSGHSADYTIGANVLGTNARTRVQNLFDANYDTVLGDVMGPDNTVATNTGAAFQIAIWEAIYDETPYDLDFGSFSVSGISQGIRDDAIKFLEAADEYQDGQKWIITELASGGSQDVGVIGAIPLPAAAWLLLTVTGGLVIAKRRNRRKDA